MNYTYDHAEIALPAKFMTSQALGIGNILAALPANILSRQFAIRQADIQNRSGGVAAIGIGGVLPQSLWMAGQWDESEYAAGAPYTDDTTDAQDDGAGDFVLDVVGTNNDGFVLACDQPFNIASFILSQASASGTAWKVYYSKASTGTGFAANYTEITNLLAVGFGTTGEMLLWFNKPQPWVPVQSATAIVNRHGAGMPTGKYIIIVKSTTAPATTAGLASTITLGHMIHSREAVADNGVFTLDVGEVVLPPYLESLACAISSVSALQSRASVLYRLR